MRFPENTSHRSYAMISGFERENLSKKWEDKEEKLLRKIPEVTPHNYTYEERRGREGERNTEGKKQGSKGSSTMPQHNSFFLE